MRAVFAKVLICFALLFVTAGNASGHVVVANDGDLPRVVATQEKLSRIRFSAETVGQMGPAPADMLNAHRHHILEVNGRFGEHRLVVREGQDILRTYDIDPLQGVESLVWAPNKGHTLNAAANLVQDLRSAQHFGVGREEIIDILSRHGQSAARR